MISEWFGGYDTTGYWAFVIGLLFVSSILNAFQNLICKCVGIGLFIWGWVALIGYINYTIESNPNLPEYASYFPLLFAILMLLTVFKMFLHSPKLKGGTKSDNEVDKP